MSQRAFVIAGDSAATIANDVEDFRYLAAIHYVAPGMQVPVRCNERAETQFMLQVGALEVMVGGLAHVLSAPSFVRVPKGVPFAYRNVSSTAARLLVRAARNGPPVKVLRPFAA